MTRAPFHTYHERSRSFRIAAICVLLAQLVAIGLSPIVEGSESPDLPTHIEAAGTPPHAGHHPGICAFCVVRHLSPLPIHLFSGARPSVVRQSPRPAMRVDFVALRYLGPDPARAPPLL